MTVGISSAFVIFEKPVKCKKIISLLWKKGVARPKDTEQIISHAHGTT